MVLDFIPRGGELPRSIIKRLGLKAKGQITPTPEGNPTNREDKETKEERLEQLRGFYFTKIPEEFNDKDFDYLDDEERKERAEKLEKENKEKDNPLENSYRGIAFSRYKNSASYCAVGVELMVTDNVEIELKRAWITVDAGEIAFKEGIEAQVEGGFIQAASWSLYEQVDFDNNEILSKDWDNYKIIEFDNIPLIKTSVINRVGYPYLGVGEAVAGPTGASISNAIRRALGERITTMPFSQESIKKQLLG